MASEVVTNSFIFALCLQALYFMWKIFIYFLDKEPLEIKPREDYVDDEPDGSNYSIMLDGTVRLEK